MTRHDGVSCDDCKKPADWTGPDERVQCDCGTTVCAACCVAFEGESYCSTCAKQKSLDVLADGIVKGFW